MLGNQECNKNIFNIQQEGGILVTKDKYKGLIPTGHAAIIYTKNSVIESLSKGVVKGKNDWNTTKTIPINLESLSQ